MKIDICVPAHNEAEIIVPALERLLAALPSPLVPTILLAENASIDGTAERVIEARLPNVQILRIKGKGKGLAIREAARVSSGDVFGFIDADLSADPSSIPELVMRLQSGADIVIGSREGSVNRVQRAFLRGMSSRAFNLVVRRLFGVHYLDTQCGLKLMNSRGRDILLMGQERGWIFDIEFLFLATRKGLRIEEHPVDWEEFRFARRKSKLRPIRDGARAFLGMATLRRRLF